MIKNKLHYTGDYIKEGKMDKLKNFEDVIIKFKINQAKYIVTFSFIFKRVYFDDISFKMA